MKLLFVKFYDIVFNSSEKLFEIVWKSVCA